MGDLWNQVQNRGKNWYRTHKRGNYKFRNETQAIYKIKCKIGDKNDTERTIGDIANLRK